MRSCCCWPCRSTGNKVLPVTFAPTQFDFLEIKPHRRLRVIHLQAKAPESSHRLKRSATTISRSSNNNFASAETEESEDEYWFENAAPKRLPIQPDTSPSKKTPKRIFNKFEPQGPPQVPGINPPKASLAKNGNAQKLSHPLQSPGQRLPRKKIIPAEELEMDDDDEDEVHDTPSDDKAVEDEETAPSVMEDNFVANVLADMSGMVISITAESTNEAKNDERSSSPTPDLDKVITQPDPKETVSKTGSDATTASVIVEGGNLGGHANVAFEGEEVDTHPKPKDDSSAQGKQLEVEASEGQDTTDQVPYTPLDEVSEKAPEKLAKPRQEKPIIFFLHGVGGSASTWTSQIEFFHDKGYEIVAPDLLGHGFSSAPDNARSYLFNKLFRDILTIYDHYVAQHRTCVIVAHSYGSSFACAVARSRPNVVLLLLLACGGPTPLAPPPVVKSFSIPMMWTCLMKPLLQCGFKWQQPRPPHSRGKALKFQEVFDVPGYVFKHIIAGQYWPEGDLNFHRRISVPTLLIYGLKDPFVSLVEMCEMERTIPKSYLELVPLAGHMIMLDQPKELNVMMNKFIVKYTVK